MAYDLGSTMDTTLSNQGAAFTGVFIPTIWSGKIVEKFYASTVLAAIANTDYEGEIRNQGDTVKIRQKPTMTINDYVAFPNSAITLSTPTVGTVDLLIDKGKYFAAVIDDVMEIQSDMDLLSMWADDAGEQMKIVIDREVLAGGNIGATASLSGGIIGAAHSTNRGQTAGAVSASIDLGIEGSGGGEVFDKDTAIPYILRLGQALDENNVPETGRWVVLPAWAIATIKNSEFKNVYVSGDSVSIARNGRIGMIDRFTVYSSNLLGIDSTDTQDTTCIFAGHPSALTFASQLTKVETLRSESYFGTIIRGLQVFGYKVVNDRALVEGFIKRST